MELHEASDLPPKESHQTGRTQRSSGSCQEGTDLFHFIVFHINIDDVRRKSRGGFLQIVSGRVRDQSPGFLQK